MVLSAASLAILIASSIFFDGTSIRVGALHDWPELFITERTPPPTADGKSASSRMMFGLLPPSSWATRLTVGAAALATSMPARVEPVKDTMAMPGWLEIAAPTSGPVPLTRLNTPFGTPAACITSAQMMAENGASSDGFSTMVQPVARAGTTLQAIWLIGQFQGVIRPQTPIGSFTRRVGPRSSSNLKFFSTSIPVAMCAMPIGAWARWARDTGAPISSVMAAATSGKRFWYSARTRCRSSMRSSRLVWEKVLKASAAAATALSTSAAEPAEILPQTSSVAGLITSRVFGVTGSTHSPLM